MKPTDLLLKLILNYYVLDKNVHVVYIFNCLNPFENVQLHKLLSARGIISGIQLTQFNYDVEKLIFILKHSVPLSVGIVVNYNCANASHLIRLASNEDLFVDKNKWLLFEQTTNVNDSAALRQLDDTVMYINAEITYVPLIEMPENHSNFPVQYPLYDIFNNAQTRGGKLNVTFDRYLFINDEESAYLTESILKRRTKYENRANMSDITMQVATIGADLHTNASQKQIIDYILAVDRSSENTLVRFSSQCPILLKDVFGYSVHYVHFHKHTSNGTYGGALGAMYEGDIDYVLSGLFFTLGRFTYITPVMTLAKFRAFLFFRTPQEINIWGDDLFRPFSGSVWICLLLSIIIIAPTLKIALDWERYKALYWQRKMGTKMAVNVERESIMATILIAFGAYCQQAADLAPNGFPPKCIYIFLFILSIFIYNFYTSILVSSLVSGPAKSDINTVWKLADSNLIFRSEQVAYVRSYLEKSSDPQARYLYSKKVKSNTSNVWTTADQGFELVRSGGYAFYSDAATAYPTISRMFESNEIRDLNQIELRTENTLGMTLKKNSPYVEMLKIKLFRMREVGILMKHRRLWIPSKPDSSSNSYVFSVGMEYTAPIFLFMACSIGATMVLLVVEVVHNHYQKTRNRKHRNRQTSVLKSR